MSFRLAVALAIALAASWVIAGPAAALDSGVFVDPGSPAGKEYGVPLSELRGEASGRPPVDNQSPPLFGIGISSPVSSAAASASATPRRASRQSAHGRPSGGRPGASGARSAGAAAAGSGAEAVSGGVLAGVTDHGSAVPAVALLGGLVVLGGLGFGGLLVAARRRLD
jgi:hypothetical protein